MKKIVLLIMLSIFSLGTIHAEITWNLADDGTLTISGTDMPNYNSPADVPWLDYGHIIKNVIIEDGVTNIGDCAFYYYCHNLTSVTIPNSVTSIGESAFSYCSSLTSITIPESVTSIGWSAFSYCSSLTTISIHNSVTKIGDRAFYGCSKLTSITIPNSVTSIGNRAFYECSSLTSVTIPNSVTSIGDWAFLKCSSLTSITIPNSVTSIGESTFKDCSGLTSVIIPNSVTSIGKSAFSGCSSLTSITIPESVTSIGAGAFSGCSSLTSITIPNSVTSIGCFSGCSSLTSITIPESVTSIGDWAFKGCSGLTSITIPNSVKNIGDDAFSGCSGLTSISIPNSVKSIGERAFYGCSSLTSITIPNSVTSIEYNSFNGCSSLTSITIPNSVTSIRGNAFNGCSSLTFISIPNSVTSIGSTVFSGCSSLTFISIPNSVRSFASQVPLEFSSLEGVIMTGETLPYNDTYLLSGLDEITTLYIPSSLYEKYRSTFPWKYITNIVGIPDESIYLTDMNIFAVIAKISTIGTVEYTDACKSKIDAASKAYEALTDAQKVLVSNLDVLTTAQQTYDNLKAAEKLAADKVKADAVIAKISAIGKVEYTNACKDKIDDASTAYNALTDDQKALVSNLDVLTSAKQTYESLKAAAEKLAADKAAAEPVIAKINSIGKVEYTYACKDKIDEANNAYNALTADQKALVTNLDILKTAKQTYDNLKAAADKLAADKAAFDKYKSEIIAIIESLVKEDDSDAVKEIINKAISEIDALKYEDAISLDDNKAKVNSFATSVNEAVENQRAEDEKTNGIEEPELAEKVNIYDLNGRKITNSMLKSGLYIRNGKKVFVK